jgi:hypothetical protein
MSKRHIAAIGGAIGSALLAGALAATINLGILRAAGPLKGPGRLGPVDVSSVVPETGQQAPGRMRANSPPTGVRPTGATKVPDGEPEANGDD